jgi:hypothetical protein
MHRFELRERATGLSEMEHVKNLLRVSAVGGITSAPMFVASLVSSGKAAEFEALGAIVTVIGACAVVGTMEARRLLRTREYRDAQGR